MKRCAVFVIAWSAATAQAPASPTHEPFPGLDAYVRATMTTWHTTGLALAIVRHDSVIYAKGYGMRTIGQPDPVDDETLFALGSCTKAFTSTAMAMLVDEGKVAWDDRVTSHLPEFQVADPYVTRELTIRDLLAHRTGVDPADFLWYQSGLDRAEIFRRMRFLPQSFSLRSQYDYVNMMYLAAGELLARVTDTSYESFVEQRILRPLGMHATLTGVRELSGRTNVASPHRRTHDTTRVVPRFDHDAVAAGGGILSSARDMGQWLRFQLAHGTIGSTRLVSAAALDETHARQIIVPFDGDSPFWPTTRQMDYGMGWLIDDYRGHRVLEHDGDVDGFTAEIKLLPDDDFGVVVLVNDEHSGAYLGLTTWLMDRDLRVSGPPRDWTAQIHRAYATAMAGFDSATAREDATRITGTHPTLPLAQYAGTYADSAYGTATLKLVNDTLRVTRGLLTGDLEHWSYNTFRVLWHVGEVEHSQLTFAIDANGVARSFRVEYLGDTATFRRYADGS